MHKEVTPVLTTWQFFLSCRTILGDVFLTTLYNRGTRQVYRWCANPDFTSQDGYERNPLDRMKTLLERLIERGRSDVALSALNILAGAVRCEVVPTMPVVPDKSTITAEMLDDYPSLVKLHDHIRANEPIDKVRHYAMMTKRDIDETVQQYINEGKPTC